MGKAQLSDIVGPNGTRTVSPVERWHFRSSGFDAVYHLPEVTETTTLLRVRSARDGNLWLSNDLTLYWTPAVANEARADEGRLCWPSYGKPATSARSGSARMVLSNPVALALGSDDQTLAFDLVSLVWDLSVK